MLCCPSTALLYGSGLILDEQEEQTLTYLLIRPCRSGGSTSPSSWPRVCMVEPAAAVFVLAHLPGDLPGVAGVVGRLSRENWSTLGVMILSMTAYVAVFGAMSLFVQRSLIVGIVYIGIVEGLLANLDFAIRQLSVMYYFRVLALNWLKLDPAAHEGRLEHHGLAAPRPADVRADAAADRRWRPRCWRCRIFTRREFYVKTPETN